MAKEPDNLVLNLLREMRADMTGVKQDMTDVRREMKDMQRELRDVHRIVDGHTMRFDFLDERVEMLREGTLTAIGFAANTGRHHIKLKEQLAELSKRVEKLEKAK